MEAGYMVSFFARNNFDYDVEDVSDRPLAARLAVPTDSPDICGFKFTSSKQFTQKISRKRIAHYVKTKEQIDFCNSHHPL